MPISKRGQGTSDSTPDLLDHSHNGHLTHSAGDTPHNLRAYIFHGLDLSIKGGQANGDCPFCGADGKFTVHIDTGKWRCWVCGGGQESGGGNPLTFLRAVHAAGASAIPPGFLAEVAADRRLCDAQTPPAWGVVRSIAPPGPWLVPGYAPDGSLYQIYKRTWSSKDEAWLLLPTPGVWPDGRVHGLHLPTADFDPECQQVHVCEGPWDGMALWEVARGSNIAPCQILAVPGCNVWRDEWTDFCRDKHVTLLFDSDHPRKQGKHTYRSGFDGMYRVARKLSGHAASLRWLRWGKEGWDESRPSGWDVRDVLSGAPARPLLLVDRRIALTSLMGRVEDAPADWFSAVSAASPNGRHGPTIEAQPCCTWRECLGTWEAAMRWRRDMSDALAVVLAVCASTLQAGNQLFLDVVGSAGSGKTTICEGLLVSHHCHHLEHLTGFHSGYKKADDQDKDCSLIARVNGKTLITPEFDVLRSSPRYSELMGQTRRIFDGKSGATYKNSDEDTLYSGLRTPWIRAGTPAIMDTDQSQLGDRFLRIIIGDPDEDEKRAIMRSAIRSERAAMVEQSNGTASSIVDPLTRRAYALTGGYVNWLRANVEELVMAVDVNTVASVDDRCADLAELTADLRARPNEDKRKKDHNDCKELPTRLARQYSRLAAHLAVVLNKSTVDNEVLGIVRKVAMDTAHGHSLNIVNWLCSVNPRDALGRSYQDSGGLFGAVLQGWLAHNSMNEERADNYMTFLRKVGVLELRTVRTNRLWMLTDRVHELYLRIMES